MEEQKETLQEYTLDKYVLEKSGIEFVTKDLMSNFEKQVHKLLPYSFICMIIGRPGSGKTFLIRELLMNEKLYFKFFDHVYTFSPSLIEGLELKKGYNYFQDIEMENLQKIIQKLNIVYKNFDSKKKKKQILFIFDDMVGSLHKFQYEKLLQNLFFNRRHIVDNGVINILFTTQSYMKIPKFIRQQVQSLFFFKLNKKEVKEIISELGYFCDKEIYDLQISKSEDLFRFIYLRFDICQAFVKFDRIKNI